MHEGTGETSRATLLEMQTALVTCITEPRALAQALAGDPRWELLKGIDLDKMSLLESMAQTKRVGKVRRILHRSLPFMSSSLARLIQEFVNDYTPRSANSYSNACQFYALLRRVWRMHPAQPPFLPDLVYCELALVSVGRRVEVPALSNFRLADPSSVKAVEVRRRPGIRWRRCQYDIRPLLSDEDGGAESVVRRTACIFLCRSLNSTGIRAFEVDESLFQIVIGLNTWTSLDLESHGRRMSHMVTLFRKLEEIGILEVRLCESA